MKFEGKSYVDSRKGTAWVYMNRKTIEKEEDEDETDLKLDRK